MVVGRGRVAPGDFDQTWKQQIGKGGGSQSKGEEGIVVFMTLSILFLLSVQGYMRGYCLHTCYLRKEENKKPDIFLKKRIFRAL